MLISKFVEASNSISKVEEQCILLTKTTATFGYDSFAYGGIVGYDLQNKSQRPAPAIALNHPEEWVKHYFSNDLKDLDPVVQYAPDFAKPFIWEALAGPFSLEKQ